jgi:hypothetical protein
MSFFKWLSDKTNAPRVRIELIIDKNQYCLNEQIKGELKIFSEEEFDVSQAVVWLTCNESIKKIRTVSNQYGASQSEYWDSADIYKTHLVLFGTSRIPQNYAGSHKFAFTIPAMARETFYSVDHYVKWFLIPSLYVTGRPSLETKSYEVLVARQQINPSAPTVTKEVVREVVLIPCSYCSGLMPQTSTFCPNCGAKRKA